MISDLKMVGLVLTLVFNYNVHCGLIEVDSTHNKGQLMDHTYSLPRKNGQVRNLKIRDGGTRSMFGVLVHLHGIKTIAKPNI